MASQTDGLTPRQRAFVAARCTGMTAKDAAASIGLSERQAQRYANMPAVRVALREAQDESLCDVTRRMNAGAGNMLDVLDEVARDREMPPAVRVSAARAWLDTAFKARELLDLAQRVAELEQRLEGDDGR